MTWPTEQRWRFAVEAAKFWLFVGLLACSSAEPAEGLAGGAGTSANNGSGGSGQTSSGGASAVGGWGSGGDIAGIGGQLASAGAGGAPRTYPEGPYGADNPDVAEVIENLTFRGYVNPSAVGLATAQPFVDYSMADFRQSGPRYALVHIGAVW